MDLGKYFKDCFFNFFEVIPKILFFISRVFYSFGHASEQFFNGFRLGWQQSQYPLSIVIQEEHQLVIEALERLKRYLSKEVKHGTD